jgi:hypothetical protein
VPLVYVGLLVAALALVGVVGGAWRSSRSPAVGQWTANPLPWLALLAFAVFVSTGPEFLARLPLTLFRYPARLVPLGVFAMVALAVMGWERIRPNRRWVDLIIIMLVLVDLLPRAWPLLRSEPFRTDVVPYAREIGAETKIIRAGIVEASKRTAWIAGYLNLYDRRFDSFSAAPLVDDEYVRAHRELLERPSRDELARRGIGWIVSEYDLRSAFAPFARAGKVNVYRNSVASPTATLMLRAPFALDPLRVQLDTSHARVTVETPREGLVVLLQQHAPGWRVTVDGAEAESLVVNRLFRGVRIGPGRHEIVWTYRPASLYGGAFVTCLTLLALTLSGFVKRTNGRKFFFLSVE